LITHVLLTRSPLSPGPKAWFSLDLHVLSAPPAFVLSQDQTLREELIAPKQQGDLFHFELVLKVCPLQRDMTGSFRFLPEPEGSVRSRRKRTLLSFQRPSLRTA
jgi:hypothetical protein